MDELGEGGIWVKARHHIVHSGVLSLLFLFIGEYWMVVTCMFFGIFIDIDHQLDFYLLFGRFTWSITELSEQLVEHSGPMFFCPLHSWEFVILLVLLSCWYSMFIGAVVGVTAHIIADIMFNIYEELSLLGDYILRFSFLYRVRGDLKLYEEFRRTYKEQLEVDSK